jgi:hypothetical protein
LSRLVLVVQREKHGSLSLETSTFGAVPRADTPEDVSVEAVAGIALKLPTNSPPMDWAGPHIPLPAQVSGGLPVFAPLDIPASLPDTL